MRAGVPAISACYTDLDDPKRASLNVSIPNGITPSFAHAAAASPMAGECLKPWPEQGETISTRSQSG